MGRVYELDEVENDPQIQHRSMVVSLDHPIEGKVKQVGISIKLSETPGMIRSFSPSKGEHTGDILQQLGYSDKDIEDLRMRGAI